MYVVINCYVDFIFVFVANFSICLSWIIFIRNIIVNPQLFPKCT